MNPGLILLASAAVLLITPIAEAKKCYSCSGLTDDKCNDPVNIDDISKKDGFGYCTKTVTDGKVTRGGGYNNKPSSGCTDTSVSSVCYCDGNLCNSADLAQPLGLIFSILAVAVAKILA